MAHVLIVDDERSQSAVLAALLRHNGHDAEHAESAVGALTRMKRRVPDLVLLDLGMPRVNGFDLLQALTNEPRFDAVRVIVYSGQTDPDAFAVAKRLGACDFIIKGEDVREAVARILSHLEEAADPKSFASAPQQYRFG
jgi:DNA-binding response OmpR family regulator